MDKFFVGQRVRIIGCGNPKNLQFVGDEQRVVRFWGEHIVLDCHPRPNGSNCILQDHLEPILPDGHRAGEGGTCEPLDKLLSEVSREAV